MKKKLVLFLAAMLCLTCFAGGTMAYYTSQTDTHNVITSGSVTVELIEYADGDGTPFQDIEGVMPGESEGKIVMAKNSGASDAWVRMRVDKYVSDTTSDSSSLDMSLVTLDIDTEHWTEKDGWYYYNSPLSPGTLSEPLFSSVSFDESMDNFWQKTKLNVDVYLQAVQVANNGQTVLEAQGWPEMNES